MLFGCFLHTILDYDISVKEINSGNCKWEQIFGQVFVWLHSAGCRLKPMTVVSGRAFSHRAQLRRMSYIPAGCLLDSANNQNSNVFMF